jgi:chromosome partitioning protein
MPPTDDPYVLAIANQKGGVGKTTTTVCLGEALARAGRRVLLIDYDGQANLTSWVLGRKLESDEVSILDVLTGEWSLADAADRADAFDLDFVGATDRLFRLEVEMAQDDFRVDALRRQVTDLRESSQEGQDGAYDFCLVDCPPALGLPVMQALMASDGLLVPTLLEKMPAEGLKKLTEALEKAQTRGGSSVELLGVVPEIVHTVRNMSEQVARPLERRFGDRFWGDCQIPVRTRISEASARSIPLKQHCLEKGSDEHEFFDALAERVIDATESARAKA